LFVCLFIRSLGLQ